MINKIKNFFYKIFYSLPFGMKAANDEMFMSKASSNFDNIGIHEVVQKESLGEDLLKGEVTQQVEELRYRTYKVAEESTKYEYIGDGIAIKKDNVINEKINFIQENKLLCADVLTELERTDKSYGKDEYTLSIIYDDIPRFKLEKYCTNFSINEINTNKYEITFYFNKYGDSYDRSTYSFINDIKEILNGKKSEFEHLIMIHFITYKSIGENDMIEYKFNNLKLKSIKENNHTYELIYLSNSIERVNLMDRFYSKSMEDKYKNKEKKNIDLDLTNVERKRYCSQCGKEISTYDGDITEKTYGYPLCQDCVKQILDISK